MIVPKGRAAEAALRGRRSRGTILERLEDYFGIPYPYEKLDILAIPQTVGFGAMENAGPHHVRLEPLLLAEARRRRRSDFQQRLRRRRGARDRAPVVRRPRDDGVVGRHLAERGVRHLDGEQDHRRSGSPSGTARVPRASTRGSAMGTDRLASARRIRQPIEVDERHRERVRRHHVPEGRGGDRDVRGLGRPGEVPRRRRSAT